MLACYFAACQLVLKSYSRTKLADHLEARGRVEQLQWFIQERRSLLLMTGSARTFLIMLILLAVLLHLRGALPEVNPWLTRLGALLITGTWVSVWVVAIPISLARYERELLLARSTLLLRPCLTLFRPVAGALHALDPVVRRVTGGTGERTAEAVSEEIISVMQEHQPEGTVDEVQKDMIEAVVDFPAITVDEIMTPRTDVHGIDASAGLEQVKQLILHNGHSRHPVYEKTIDHVVGVLYAKDLIRLIGETEPFNLREVMRDALMVPETKSVRDLLAEFKARNVHIAIVLDEYGGTAGLITIEDILEEIVGDIRDEYETKEESPTILRVDDDTVEVDGRVHVDVVNDELDLELPEDRDYDTVGGFVFSTLGHIPARGERFSYKNAQITVIEAERTKVKRVRFRMLEDAEAAADEDGRHAPVAG